MNTNRGHRQSIERRATQLSKEPLIKLWSEKQERACGWKMKIQSIFKGLVGVVMIGGFLAQMWDLFEEFLSELKTVAVSYEVVHVVEFPSFAFCDSRAFRRKTNVTGNATLYNATAFNLEEDVSVNNDSGLLEDPTKMYTTKILPTAYNGYCKLFEFKKELPDYTMISK